MVDPVDGRRVLRSPGAELRRKAIHLGTLAAPLAVWLLPRPAALSLLAAAVGMALVIELSRREVRWVRYHFLSRTRTLLRSHERRGLSGATFMAIGYLVAASAFPRPVAVVAMLYNGLGDAVAALVGRRWGRHRLRSGKSWEGAGAAFAVNLGCGLFVPGIPLAAAAFGALAATLLELLPLPFDDNLRITVGGGLALWTALLLTPGS